MPVLSFKLNFNNNKMENEHLKTAGPVNPSQTKTEKSKSFVKRNPVITTVLIGIIAVVAVYFWKDIEGNRQRAAIEKMATAQLNENNQTMLKLLAKPLVWSIRAEMLRGNMEQVNIFSSDIVKEQNIQFMYIINPAGEFIVSTDKKLEGKSATDMFDAALLQTDSVIVVNNQDGLLTLAAPVMGFDKRLAVIIMKYAAKGFLNPAAATDGTDLKQ